MDSVSLPLLAALGATASVGLSSLGAAIAMRNIAKNDDKDEFKGEYETTSETPLLPVIAATARVARYKGARLIPVIMAGCLAIYGLIIATLITSDLHRLIHPSSNATSVSAYSLEPSTIAARSFSGGLTIGLAALAAGIALRPIPKDPSRYVNATLFNVFAEALGLYGLIIALQILMVR